MKEREILIICRNRGASVDSPRLSFSGLFIFISYLKNKYFFIRPKIDSGVKRIRSRILYNIMAPEWIRLHRFGIFDLLNYLLNRNKYVYHPEKSDHFYNPNGIPTITSLYIYDFLTKKGYAPVNMDNMAVHQADFKKKTKEGPLAVVISATYIEAAEIKRIISLIRKNNKYIPIILGSSVLLTRLDTNGHLTCEYEELITENVYCIIEEDGLSTLDTLLNHLNRGLDIQAIHNLAFLKKDTIVYTQRQIKLINWDTNFPDWSNLTKITKGIAFVRASQGCAFRCKFCTFPKASIKLTQRSVESIRKELKSIKAAGIENLAFTDDHFAVTPKRIEETCRMMIDEKLTLNWFAGIRASSITESNAVLLRDSGCKVLCVGLESGDDRMLKLMDKRTSTSDNMRCLEILNKNNIIAYGSFMIGFPGETDESIENTINFINNSPLQLYKIYVFYLLKGSIIYDEQAQHNITYFGGNYDFYLWKTPSMDALKASEWLKRFILSVKNAALIYNYSPMYAFFPFFLRGYSSNNVVAFFKAHTEIVKSELSSLPRREKKKIYNNKLMELNSMIMKNSEGRII